MHAHLSRLVLGLLVTWLHLRRVGIGAISSQGKSWDRCVSEEQALRQKNHVLPSPGLRGRRRTWRKNRAERCLAPGISYDPVTMSSLRILHISDHVAQFITSVPISSHSLRRAGRFSFSSGHWLFSSEDHRILRLSLLQTVPVCFPGKECQGWKEKSLQWECWILGDSL